MHTHQEDWQKRFSLIISQSGPASCIFAKLVTFVTFLVVHAKTHRTYIILGGVLMGTLPLTAGLIALTDLDVTVPTGSNNPVNGGLAASPYVDDVFIQTLEFGGIRYSRGNGQLLSVRSAYVQSGRNQINAEWGDQDTASDGDDNPFNKALLDPAAKEVTTPEVQDLAIAHSFFGYSLVEGSDGEGGSSIVNLMFTQGITDNDLGVDGAPEIILFERGNNDNSTIRLITGGTFDNPVLADQSVSISRGGLTNTGVYINTTEIGGSQQLAAGAWDLNDFFAGTPEPVYGIQIQTSGGDFYGTFLSTLSDSQVISTTPDLQNIDGQVPENLLVPEVSPLMMVGGSTILFMLARFRKRYTEEGKTVTEP